MLAKNEGGRQKPIFSRDTLQFFVRAADVSGTVELCNGVGMMMPGDSAEVSVVLCHAIAMKELSRFFIREGNRTIGYGVVTRTEAEARTSA
jgi:elongation factor Tu